MTPGRTAGLPGNSDALSNTLPNPSPLLLQIEQPPWRVFPKDIFLSERAASNPETMSGWERILGLDFWREELLLTQGLLTQAPWASYGRLFSPALKMATTGWPSPPRKLSEEADKITHQEVSGNHTELFKHLSLPLCCLPRSCPSYKAHLCLQVGGGGGLRFSCGDDPRV